MVLLIHRLHNCIHVYLLVIYKITIFLCVFVTQASTVSHIMFVGFI